MEKICFSKNGKYGYKKNLLLYLSPTSPARPEQVSSFETTWSCRLLSSADPVFFISSCFVLSWWWIRVASKKCSKEGDWLQKVEENRDKRKYHVKRTSAFHLENSLSVWDKIWRGGIAVKKSKGACYQEGQTWQTIKNACRLWYNWYFHLVWLNACQKSKSTRC